MVSQIKKAKLKIVVSNHLQKWSQKLKGHLKQTSVFDPRMNFRDF